MNSLFVILLMSSPGEPAAVGHLQELEQVDHFKIVCGCSFKEVVPGADDRLYGSGSATIGLNWPEVIVLNPNAEVSHAIINAGAGNIELVAAKQGPLDYKCNKGEKFNSRWEGEEIEVELKIEVLSEGAEACWFKGTLKATSSSFSQSVPIKGVCGC